MRKVLILGATSAIAQETARLFAASGARLFLVGRNEKRLCVLRDDLQVRGAERVRYAVCDLNETDRHESLIKAAAEALNGLDTVLIAHGTLADQTACQESYALAERELRTNFLSAVSLLTVLANRFERERQGSIAVISSVAGDRGRQSNYVYGAAKGGLSVFLQGLTQRLHKSGVSVLTVKPGFVDTPMTAGFRKGFLWVGPERIARGIYRAIESRRSTVYLPWFWQGIMAAIRATPEFVFRRLAL
ncbi:MAG: SDR family oxidoreductase [Acidiferrobacteraceae bacterium]